MPMVIKDGKNIHKDYSFGTGDIIGKVQQAVLAGQAPMVLLLLLRMIKLPLLHPHAALPNPAHHGPCRPLRSSATPTPTPNPTHPDASRPCPHAGPVWDGAHLHAPRDQEEVCVQVHCQAQADAPHGDPGREAVRALCVLQVARGVLRACIRLPARTSSSQATRQATVPLIKPRLKSRLLCSGACPALQGDPSDEPPGRWVQG